VKAPVLRAAFLDQFLTQPYICKPAVASGSPI